MDFRFKSFVSYSLQEEESCEGTNVEVIIAYTVALMRTISPNVIERFHSQERIRTGGQSKSV